MLSLEASPSFSFKTGKMKSKLIQALLFIIMIYACSPSSTSEGYQAEKEKLFTLLQPEQTGVNFQKRSQHFVVYPG